MGAKAHQARLLPASTASGAPDTTTSLPSADLTLIFIVIFLVGKEAAMWKDKTGDKRIFLCFRLHTWLIRTGLFLPSLGINASRRRAAKLRLFLLLWKMKLSFFHPALWGFWGNGCKCVQHIAQLAPILLGPLSVIKINTKWSGLNYNLDILCSGNRLQEPLTCTLRHWIYCWHKGESM